MIEYVLGFLFHGDAANRQVALIRKTKPDWQAGKLNGIGGKVENGETLKQAMFREFKEETGVKHSSWSCFCLLRYKEARVFCYRGEVEGQPTPLMKLTDEEPFWIYTDILDDRQQMVKNLPWLVMMADSDYQSFRVIDHAS